MPKPTPWYAWLILAAALIGIAIITALSFTGCATPAPMQNVNPAALKDCPSRDLARCRAAHLH